MPLDCLHMTALEIDHSRSAEEIARLISVILPRVAEITDYTFNHRARLIKPMLSFDNAAIALSFLPAAWEGTELTPAGDLYTYHHLRSDLYNLCSEVGVTIESRYVVPSSHLTIGRFVSSRSFSKDENDLESRVPDAEKMMRWVNKIDEINQWLKDEYWPRDDKTSVTTDGEWTVGEEKGLDCRFGTLWYGGGETLRLGRGF